MGHTSWFALIILLQVGQFDSSGTALTTRGMHHKLSHQIDALQTQEY